MANTHKFKPEEIRRALSIFFFLKTLGKNRGFVERIESTGKDGKDIIPVLKITIQDDPDSRS